MLGPIRRPAIREPLRFSPIYQDRIWGGRAFAVALHRRLPSDRLIGESWEMVDRADAQSVVCGGPFEGRTLEELRRLAAAELFGPTWPANRRFPLLVKWLDCRERLSLQVHPPASGRSIAGEEPKTENWYVADAVAGAEVIVGLKQGMTRTEFEKNISTGTIETCLEHIPVGIGDSILVPSGVVHAIGGGNLILEIQQNSDTTYRVFDWGRVGPDGKPRQMHVERSLASIDWGASGSAPIRAVPVSGVIAVCEHFRIRRVVLGEGERLVIPGGEQPRILSVITGQLTGLAPESGEISSPVQQIGIGDNVLLPYAGHFNFRAGARTIALVTENFV